MATDELHHFSAEIKKRAELDYWGLQRLAFIFLRTVDFHDCVLLVFGPLVAPDSESALCVSAWSGTPRGQRGVHTKGVIRPQQAPGVEAEVTGVATAV